MHNDTMPLTRRMLAAIGLLCATSLAIAEAPHIDPRDDHKHLGSPDNVLEWTPAQQVASYRNSDKIFPTRTISAGANAYPLPSAPQDLDNLDIRLGEASMNLQDLLAQQSVAGLLVIKDGSIAYERYRLGNNEETRWVSYSVTKSVVSMLVGAAIKDGYIKSVDEKVTRYLPHLQSSSYDDVTIENLLQMASGVEWDENYANPDSDIASVSWETLALNEHLRNKPRLAEPGATFNYNTAETNLVGTLLRSAIGNNLSTYLSNKIWRPFGMESDAVWPLTEPGGGEFGGCCIAATLRDYARIGLFALANGELGDGSVVLPADWMQASTAPSDGFAGYGYFWWLYGDGVYAASGIFGQGILIDRNNNVVIAIHSARPKASNDADWAWQDAMFRSIVQAVSR